MSESAWVIVWWNGSRNEREWEFFDTEAEARAAFAEYGQRYKHNTYHLAQVVGVAVATQKQQDHPTIAVVSDEGLGYHGPKVRDRG